MRLWPIAIIDQLPRQQLLGQHRECCALRGKGWGRKHSTVDYVFKHPYIYLFAYHKKVMYEMLNRGYKLSIEWGCCDYRGRTIGDDHSTFTSWNHKTIECLRNCEAVYIEHDEKYLDECISNLASKGVKIDRDKALKRMFAA